MFILQQSRSCKSLWLQILWLLFFVYTWQIFSMYSDSLLCLCWSFSQLCCKELKYKQCAVNACAFSKAVLLLHYSHEIPVSLCRHLNPNPPHKIYVLISFLTGVDFSPEFSSFGFTLYHKPRMALVWTRTSKLTITVPPQPTYLIFYTWTAILFWASLMNA